MIALGFSFMVLGGVALEATINFLNHGNLRWIWNLEIILEESLEMVGSLFVTYAGILLLDSIKRLKREQ